jgi:hypothetical protein
MLTDVSEEHVTSIFRVQEEEQEISVKQLADRAPLARRFMLVSTTTMKREATCSSESRLTFNELNGVTSQKIELYTTTAVRTSNATFPLKFQ